MQDHTALMIAFYDLLEKIAIGVGAVVVFVIGVLYIADRKKPPN